MAFWSSKHRKDPQEGAFPRALQEYGHVATLVLWQEATGYVSTEDATRLLHAHRDVYEQYLRRSVKAPVTYDDPPSAEHVRSATEELKRQLLEAYPRLAAAVRQVEQYQERTR